MTAIMQDDDETVAEHGEKMIEIRVRFWTNRIAERQGHIIPKHARTSGVVKITRNDAHGIVPGTPAPFNSLLDMGAAIEDVLIEHGITLHASRGQKRYLKCID